MLAKIVAVVVVADGTGTGPISVDLVAEKFVVSLVFVAEIAVVVERIVPVWSRVSGEQHVFGKWEQELVQATFVGFGVKFVELQEMFVAVSAVDRLHWAVSSRVGDHFGMVYC